MTRQNRKAGLFEPSYSISPFIGWFLSRWKIFLGKNEKTHTILLSNILYALVFVTSDLLLGIYYLRVLYMSYLGVLLTPSNHLSIQ